MKQILHISSFLAFKEIWRNRGRFLLVALVIALITLLVLFIAALGEGLGNGNREYLSKVDAQLSRPSRIISSVPAAWIATAWLPSRGWTAWRTRACWALPAPT
jgi:hypothetical protein